MDILNTSCFEPEYLRRNVFTDPARCLVRECLDRTMTRGLRGRVPPAMLLWTLLRWERKLGTIVLEDCGVVLRALERDVEPLLTASDAANQTIDCEALNEILARSCEESSHRRDGYAGTEHIMLALVKSDDRALRQVFAKYAVTPEKYVQALDRLLEESRRER